MVPPRLIPFVPGFAQGRLLAGIEPRGEPYVAVVDQAMLEARRLEPDPALRGVVVTRAAPLSHPLLRLRAWDRPVVLAREAGDLPLGERVWLDAVHGRLSRHPLPAPDPLPPAPQSLCTADGSAVTLLASVGDAETAARAVSRGAAGIGLFRSELLVPESDTIPDQAFFEARLGAVCAAAGGRVVTVRLLDVAADKRPPWVPAWPAIQATLGLQGVRLWNHEPVRSVVLAELDAIGRLAQRHPLRVLLPYVTSREELERWAAEARSRAPVPVGTMLETPAAALAVDGLLEVADFAVLGCNDLMQCLFAANRDQAAVADRLDFHAPVLYRFLGEVLERAGDAQRLQVNGLASQWPGVLPLLLGLGFRRFSVDPVVIPWLAATIGTVRVSAAADLARTVCRLRRSEDVRALIGL